MDFWLTDDHIALQDGIRSFLQGRFTLDDLRAVEETDAVIDVGRWRELAEMGVFSLRADGMEMRDAVLVFEELGRAIVPGPLVATHLVAGLVDGAAEGTTIVGLLDPQDVATIVEHAGQVDALIRFDGDTLVRHDPSTIEWQRLARPLEALAPTWRAIGEIPAGEVIASGDTVLQMHRAGVLLTAALQLGVALSAVDLATQYAKEREQFGRPIGSFQAVKHLLAEMLVKAEVARAGVYAAACAFDGASDDDPDRAASVAKVMAGEAALFNGKTGIQVHGGMGFTWEVDAQRYWKRAVTLDNTFGQTDHHSAAVAATL